MSNAWDGRGPIGIWQVTGTTPDGETYKGHLTVERACDLYFCNWRTGRGYLAGTGVMINGKLVVARSRSLLRPGVVWYTQARGGSLTAVWNNRETATLLGTGISTPPKPGSNASNGLSGKRDITYYYPDGKQSPPLVLDIEEPSPDLFQLTWSIPGAPSPLLFGAGLAVVNGLAAAWGPSKSGELLVFNPTGGNQAKAGLASVGANQLGGETLTRDDNWPGTSEPPKAEDAR